MNKLEIECSLTGDVDYEGCKMKDLDEIDERIIDIMKSNARTSLSAIAEELGLSKTAVKKRIDRLVSSGVIRRYTIELSTESVVRALVFVKTEAKGRTTEVAQSVKKIRYVDKVFEVSGDYDIVAIVTSPTVEKLNESIDNIREVPHVASTVTVMVLKEY